MQRPLMTVGHGTKTEHAVSEVHQRNGKPLADAPGSDREAVHPSEPHHGGSGDCAMKSIQVNVPGGPENLQLMDVPTPRPGHGQALVRIAASGVNFIDIYFRTGLYKAALPIAIGSEAAGTVEAVGEGVTEVAPGDRVAYAMARGSYAEYAVVPAAQLVKLPEHVDFHMAAAAMLQGMTAHYLTHSTFSLKAGDTCVVHAAAGGAGGLIVQMAKNIGARVLGTVSTAEKAEIARHAGADEIILYTEQEFDVEARRLTGGRGARS